MYYFYVLLNDRGELYKGISNNPDRRLREHNKGYSPGTRGKGPWRIVYSEKHDSLLEARKREKYFKSGIGREKLKKIISPHSSMD